MAVENRKASATDSFDIVVVGAGAGGMTAASVSAASGMKTLLLEKTEFVGGTMAVSGGMVWAPNCNFDEARTDTPIEAATYLDETVPIEDGLPLRHAFLKAAPKAIAYLQENTAVQLKPVPIYPDYYPDARGATTNGRVLEPLPFDGRELGPAFHRLRPPLPEFTLLGGMMVARTDIPHFINMFVSLKSAARVALLVAAYLPQRARYYRGTDLVLGNALAGRLLKSLLDRSVPIRFNVNVRQIVRDGERVSGVVVVENGAETFIAARRGVILATGGFSHDENRRRSLLPREAQKFSAAVESASGDGLQLGCEAGGHVAQGELGPAYWAPVSRYTNADGRRVIYPHTVTDRGKPGLIAVNSEARRFTNEADSYHEFVRAMLRPGTNASAVPAHLICDRRFLWKYGLGAIKPMTLRLKRFKDAGYLTEARSIRELAESLGLDENALTATVERYNRQARDGFDPEFGRGSNVYQRFLGDASVEPNPCLATIEAPPFFSVTVYPADLGTASGLVTNRDASVLADSGEPIPGLYACGNDMLSIMRGAYPGPGITLGPALTFGYLAATHAARATA